MRYGRFNADGSPDLRTAYHPMTDAVRALLTAELESGWLTPWVLTVLPRWLIVRAGIELCLSCAHEQLVSQASSWRPDGGQTFRSWCMTGLKSFLYSRVRRALRKAKAWTQMPVGEDGEEFLEPADHREPSPERALHLWCDEEYARQRRCLDMRRRVILYLRLVEGWFLEEVAEGLGVTRERVRQLEVKAISKLAEFRVRDQLRKHRTGVA